MNETPSIILTPSGSLPTDILPAVLTPEFKGLVVVGGRAFMVQVQRDDDAPPPWVDRDGVGVVFQRHTDPTRAASAGCENIGHGWVFDYQATYDKAVDEEWGPDPTTATDLERDRCMGWCDGTWWYVGWVIKDATLQVVDSCWGYESDSMEYVRGEVIDALAQQWRLGSELSRAVTPAMIRMLHKVDP